MSFLVCFLLCIIFAFVFYALISFIRFVCVHLKAFVIRKKLLKLCETENNRDD